MQTGEIIRLPARFVDVETVRSRLRQRGALNRNAMTIGDNTYEPGQLVFLGFRNTGNDPATGTVHGVWSFRFAQPGDMQRDVHDFSECLQTEVTSESDS